MATTQTQAQPVTATRSPLVAPRSRRRPGMIALGLALVLVGALATVWLVASASNRISVVAVGQKVPAGQSITAADLMTLDVAAEPLLSTVPAASMDALVGQVAVSTLHPGELLTPGRISPQGPPFAGQVLVPIALAPEALPGLSLTIGTHLEIIDTPDELDAVEPPIEVEVVGIGAPDMSGRVVLDVTTAKADGATLATRARSGKFAVVLLPVRGES